MKKHIVSTLLFTLVITAPGYADCPLSHKDKSDKNITSTKPAPVVQSHSFATPDSTVSWHDLHWFE